ncbi:MAG: XkdF-like putative serine protease domain-containing protein, partial [Salinivenus sp.]
MPFAGFESFEDCLETMTEGEGHDEASAEDICGALQAEEKSEHGDPEGLLQALRNASGLIADVGVDLVSGVDVPAVDSKWVMFKDGGGRRGHDYRVDTPVLLDKDAADAEKRIAYAAAMIPREPDKEGDVAPTATVEKAAHDFLKDGGGIDTDHSLIDGEGDPVESWILKADWEFDLPDGGSETYPEGTWMLGIEWGAEAWQRINDGELTGLSIYGMAQHVPLERASSCVECGDRLTTKAPATEGMGSDDPPIEITDDAAQALAQELSEPLSEAAGTAVKDALPEDIDKQSADELIQEFAERLAETGETDKEADTI